MSARQPGRLAVLAILLSAMAPAASRARAQTRPIDPPAFEEPMPLYEAGLGSYQRKITTGSEEAQAYFTQGVQLLFAFTPTDAARSFREAQKRDPQCAMCFWGEGMAWGPYLNGNMSAGDAPRAYHAVQEALRLAPEHTTPVERALIEALGTRYDREHDAVRRERLDSTYANAMATVFEQYPQDLEVGTFYAEALMLLEPRRGRWTVAKPSVQRIHAILEHVLSTDIRHPGACHLFIHATESTSMPGKAEACADHLGQAIPGASHINHMPSHTYSRIGRWGDAVRANVQAWHSDQRAEIGEGFAIYPSHNLHMLLFAASFDGQGAVAVQAARDYKKIVRGGSFYEALVLLRFGRFEEILEMDDAPREHAIHCGLYDFARGYAHLRNGSADSARAYLDKVREGAAKGDSVQFRGHTAGSLLSIVGAILESELYRVDGRFADAIRMLEAVVQTEDALTYDEPEPLNFSVRHWLGAVLLEAGRAADAERVYRAELEDHPNNGWSLIGLEASLRAQDRAAQAAAVRTEFEAAWQRADTWIRSSRF